MTNGLVRHSMGKICQMMSEEDQILEGLDIPPAATGEVWKPVVGWEDLYAVSSHGKVWSLPRTSRYTRDRKQVTRTRKGALSKCNPGPGGYTKVTLSDKEADRRVTAAVHILVAEAFLGPRPSREHIVNHIDGSTTPLINTVENLEWSTPAENSQHAHDTGLVDVRRGENHTSSKLSSDQVAQLVRMVEGGSPYRDVAEKFGISRGHVSYIMRGRGRSEESGIDCSSAKDWRIHRKLKNADRVRIRELVASGLQQKEVSRMFGVAPTTVNKIVLRKTGTKPRQPAPDPETEIPSSLSGEEWRPVKGWEDCFLVSSYGRLWSRTRENAYIRAGVKVKEIIRGKIRTTKPTTNGYVLKRLEDRRTGRKQHVRMHVLVAEAFLPPPPSHDSVVHHIDHVKHNNNRDNLEWVSPKENLEYAHKAERYPLHVSTSHPQSALTTDQVLDTLRLSREGNSGAEIARRFGVSKSTISNILTGRRYSDITGIRRKG